MTSAVRRGGAVLLLAMTMTLSACGLQPLYSGGSQGVVAQSLGAVEVAPIPNRAGWLVKNGLSQRLGTFGGATPQYRLVVKLDDQIEGFGVRSNDTITRERRTLRARYQLVRLADDVVVVDATTGADAGIDVVSSEYATVAAEDTALENLAERIADRIVQRLSLYARSAAAE